MSEIVSQKAERRQNKVAYKELKTQVLSSMFKPRKRRRKKLHSKNPFLVKNYDYMLLEAHRRIKPPVKMDGFYLMKVSKCEVPHEVVKLNLNGKNIHEVVNEDLKFFNNLIDLDLSENKISLDQLTNLPSLVVLSLQDNQIKEIKVIDNQFPNLQMLDISYNQVNQETIPKLTLCENLQVLNLAGNYLEDLPEQLGNFKSLEFLDVSSNEFRSNQNAAKLWKSIASIENLKHLNVARNYLRGIHTEKLMAGDFEKLEHLDFGYNSCENQHNLICARNFKSLKVLIITGNPFGIMKQHKGLEMELYARTGCVIINNDVERPYLKKPSKQGKPKIQYTNLITLKETILKSKPKSEFFGVDLPDDEEMLQIQHTEREEEEQPLEEEDQLLEEEEQQPEEEEEEEEKPEEKDSLFFMTQAQQSARKQQKPKIKNGVTNLYDFMSASKVVLGEDVHYQNQKLNLQSAYKLLKNYVKRSSVHVDNSLGNQAPHYLKSTVSQPRFKFTKNAQRILQKANKQARREELINQGKKGNDLMRIENIIDRQFRGLNPDQK